MYNVHMKDSTEFGKRFCAALEYAGYKDMSVRNLADRLGVGFTSIDCWKRGAKTPSAERQIQLSDHLGVDAGWLITGRGVMNDDPAIKILAQIVSQMNDIQRKEVFDYAAYILERGADKSKREGEPQSNTENLREL